MDGFLRDANVGGKPKESTLSDCGGEIPRDRIIFLLMSPRTAMSPTPGAGRSGCCSSQAVNKAACLLASHDIPGGHRRDTGTPRFHSRGNIQNMTRCHIFYDTTHELLASQKKQIGLIT